MIIKHKIVMDLDRGDERKYIDVMQDDKYSRDLELILRSNLKEFCPPEGCTVLARYKKSNGQTGMYDTMPDGTSAWSIEGNILTLRLAPQVCTVVGKVMLTVTLLQGDAELSCFAVCVNVHEGPGRIMKSERYSNITGFVPQPKHAAVGQYIRVLETDDKGRITAVETAREVAVAGKDGADGYTPVKGKDYFDGKDGKSAYAYAREGGYTGTEAEFAAKLAEETPDTLPNPNYLTFLDELSVNNVDYYNGSQEKNLYIRKVIYIQITENGNSSWTASETFEKIATYVRLGWSVCCVAYDVVCALMAFDDTGFVFGVTVSIGCGFNTIGVTIASDNSVTVTFGETTALPNPNALTINGVSYDGSETVNLTIESGGDNIPDYVRTEAERLATVVQSRQNENTVSAILSSDYHLPNSSHAYYAQILESITHAGQAMGILRNQLSIDFEAKLGDLIWDSGETQGEALANFQLVHSLVSEGNVLDRFEGNGNHDHLQSNSTPLTDSQVYANIGIYNKDCVRDSANRAGGYCYKDYEEYKLRVILLNTSEAKDGSFAVSSAQAAWLGEALAVPVEEGWGTLILSHHPLDWGGSSTEVMNKIKGASGVIANLHGHVHTFTQNVITGTEIPRLAIPNVCFYRNNEYGTNGKAENSEGIEFGTTSTYSKTAKTANDTAFCVLTLDRAAGKLYLDRYGAGIDREEDVPTWGKKGYINLVPTSEAADSTEPYNGTGYKNGVYLSSSGGDGEDSACVATGYIPYSWAKGNVLYVKGADVTTESHMRIYGYRSKGIAPDGSASCAGTNMDTHFTLEKLGDKYYKLTHKLEATMVTYLRLSLIGTGENLIVTANEPIEE